MTDEEKRSCEFEWLVYEVTVEHTRYLGCVVAFTQPEALLKAFERWPNEARVTVRERREAKSTDRVRRWRDANREHLRNYRAAYMRHYRKHGPKRNA